MEGRVHVGFPIHEILYVFPGVEFHQEPVDVNENQEEGKNPNVPTVFLLRGLHDLIAGEGEENRDENEPKPSPKNQTRNGKRQKDQRDDDAIEQTLFLLLV